MTSQTSPLGGPTGSGLVARRIPESARAALPRPTMSARFALPLEHSHSGDGPRMAGANSDVLLGPRRAVTSHVAGGATGEPVSIATNERAQRSWVGKEGDMRRNASCALILVLAFAFTLIGTSVPTRAKAT